MGPIQATECQLDLDVNLSLREDVTTYLSEMVAENEYAIHVLRVLQDDILLVDLMDKTTNQNIKDVLLQRFVLAPQSSSQSSSGLLEDDFRPTNKSLQSEFCYLIL